MILALSRFLLEGLRSRQVEGKIGCSPDGRPARIVLKSSQHLYGSAFSGRPASGGAVVLDPNRREVTISGRRVRLTSLEFRLLRLLAETPGRACSRDELQTRLRAPGAKTPAGRTLDNLVVRLRRKLGDPARRPRIIEAVWGVGYRLIDRSTPASRQRTAAAESEPTHEGRPAPDSLFRALEHAGDAAIAIDADQRVVLWNAAAEALLGWRRDETLGRPCHEVLCGRDRSGHLACCEHCPEMVMARRGEPIRSRDLSYRARDGHDVWVNVSTLVVTPQDQHSGPITVHLFRDLRNQRRLEDLIETIAAHSGTAAAVPSPLDGLTKREREILAFLARGTGTRAIAGALFISPITARNHIQNLLRKLSAHSRAEAVALGVRHGLSF